VPHLRFDPDRSTLEIDGRSSVHPIRATADGVVGWIDLDDRGGPLSGHLTVEVERLRTGNPLYDREIRNRLDATTFPTFEAHLTAVREPAGVDGPWPVTGAVSAHGVQVDLDGAITVEPDGDGVRVAGDERVDFRRFGLKAPRLLTLRVDPIVTVSLDATTFTPDPPD
jgi:polyisoprenoid-binding protein YceI